jgi:16S rRNA (cytosine1402-N4)-methyltransferase
MRMDQSAGLTAAEVLNTYEVGELERILREYGEERFARKVARAIVRERESEPFTTSARLVELLKRTVPGASQKSGGHPGKRTFQALRIEVNAELSAWATALPAAVASLAVGGRLAVLSYHSLEDRITKRVFAEGAHSRAPEGLPVELPEHAAYLRLLTRGAEEPSADEKSANPRSASARLRAVERTRPTKGTTR